MTNSIFFPGDCRDILPTLPRSSVQLIITSPPYNVGWRYADQGESDRLPLHDYLHGVLAPALHECYGVLHTGGVLALNLPSTTDLGERGQRRNPAQPRLHPSAAWATMHLAGGPWLLREPIAWVKGDEGQPLATSTAWGAPTISYLRPCYEQVLLASKETYRIDGQSFTRQDIALDCFKDVWHIRPARSPASGLPAPFPDELVKRLVVMFSRPGDVVLDPFAGLGTVGRIAVSLGRQAWLIERNPAYWPRLDAFASQVMLCSA